MGLETSRDFLGLEPYDTDTLASSVIISEPRERIIKPQSTENSQSTEAPPRIAASSYLNTAPLIWSFTRGSRQGAVLLTDAVPARCADLLRQGLVDAALVPVIEYQRLPDVAVIPDVCVGSLERVRSVVLASKVDNLKDVRRIAVDESSRTSAALLKIIFREFLGSEPEWTSAAPDVNRMLADNDGALIIGDPGMTFARGNLRLYDMAELWRAHTGLGFVFALWMVSTAQGKTPPRVDFAGARDEGLERAEEIVACYEPLLNLSRAELRSYLSENISFSISEEMRAGMELYFQLAYKHGLITGLKPLKTIAA